MIMLIKWCIKIGSAKLPMSDMVNPEMKASRVPLWWLYLSGIEAGACLDGFEDVLQLTGMMVTECGAASIVVLRILSCFEPASSSPSSRREVRGIPRPPVYDVEAMYLPPLDGSALTPRAVALLRLVL